MICSNISNGWLLSRLSWQRWQPSAQLRPIIKEWCLQENRSSLTPDTSSQEAGADCVIKSLTWLLTWRDRMGSDVRCGDNAGGGRDVVRSVRCWIDLSTLHHQPGQTSGTRKIVNNYSPNQTDLLATGFTMVETCQNWFFELEDKRDKNC